jgi:RecJ-like exonuclease
MAASSKKMLGEFKKASDIIRDSAKNPIRVLTHNDADGISSGAIIHKALLREGIGAVTRSVKKLDGEIISAVAREEPQIVIFTDQGSGQMREIEKYLLEKCSVLVLDHHQPIEYFHENLVHINPHFYGIDGARQVSGSGMAYLLAKTLDASNVDLSPLAVVGALGDIQDADGRFHGVNREIISDGVKAGLLKVEKDLRLFGRQTRPLFKAIEYTTEPFIPGLSGSESACVQFLNDLDIPIKKNGDFTMLADLDKDEQKRLVTALILKMIEYKIPPKIAENIVGEVCTLLKEEKRTPLRDAKEFATLLNACGKNSSYGIGFAVCLGERGELYRKALDLLQEHKSYISSCYSWISQNIDRIKKGSSIYYFHAQGEISEYVLGTVVSMVINSRILDPILPVVGMTFTEEGEVKASSRGTRELIEKGLNLGKAMQFSAEKVGGLGGGHDIAAGAQIEKGKEEEFIRHVDEFIKEQMRDAC